MDSVVDLFWKQQAQDTKRVEKIKGFIRLNLGLKNLPEVVSKKYGVSTDKAREWIDWVDLWYSGKEKKAQQEIDGDNRYTFPPEPDSFRLEEVPKRERRFRGSIYVDIWIPKTEDLEKDREAAEDYLREYQKEIPNSYVGGVAVYNPGFKDHLDREI